MSKNCKLLTISLITQVQKVLKKKILSYNVLESSRCKLQEYAVENSRFHLRNCRRTLCDLQTTIQNQVFITILCLPSSQTTFVFHTFRDICLGRLK